MDYPQISIGEFATPISRVVPVVPGNKYRLLGVKWWGEGVYERNTVDGAEIQAKTLSIVRCDDLIINKIWVRHGSSGIIPPDMDGCGATGEFPTFELDKSKVDKLWLLFLFKTKWFWEQCSLKSQGTSGKNRIKPGEYLKIKIPLPSLAEQQRIVGRIEKLAGKVEEARRLRAAAAGETAQLVTSLSRTIFDNANWPEVPLFELLTQDTRNGIGRKPSDEPIGVPILRISAGTSRSDAIVDETDHKYIEVTERELEAYTLEKDDLLACRFNGNLRFVGRFSLYQGFSNQVQVYPDKLIRFRVDKAKVMPEYVRIAANSPKVRGVIEGFCATTAGNLGISASNLKTVTIPVPPLNTQKQIVKLVDQMHTKVNTLIKLQANTQHEIDALLPSILDKAFKGEL